MYYTLIGLVALLTLLITNYDLLAPKYGGAGVPAKKAYRRFLTAVIVYYLADMLWGVLDSLAMIAPLYADTEIYFVAMALGILLWTQYVIAYLDEKNTFSAFLFYAGRAYFAVMVLLMALNIFYPIMFWFDENGGYHAEATRYVMLIVQILLFLLTSVYAVYISKRTRNAAKNRYRTIGMFGLVMGVFIFFQLFYPLLPLYSIACMLGSCILHTFVIEEEKEEYRRNLEASLRREEQQLQELNATWKLAYTDALTGIKSPLAHAEKERQIDKKISDGTAEEIAVAVFDINDLKNTNDTMGHDAGDKMIISACRLICDCFRGSPVFRVGGDEIVAILEGEDYRNRERLLSSFNRQIDENRANGRTIIAAGMAEYVPGKDGAYRQIFERADQRMYHRKSELKTQ